SASARRVLKAIVFMAPRIADCGAAPTLSAADRCADGFRAQSMTSGYHAAGRDHHPLHMSSPGSISAATPIVPVSDAMLRAACEAVRVGICLVAAAGRFVLVHPAFCALS